jgi:hypothetical protein
MAEPLRDLLWAPTDIAYEFGLSKATVYRRLKDAGLTGAEGTYTTRQVTEALFSSYTAERTKLVVLQKEEQEMRVAQMRGQLIDKQELTNALASIFISIRNIVQTSDLPKKDQLDILNNIAGMPILVEEATRQSQKAVGVQEEKKDEASDA